MLPAVQISSASYEHLPEVARIHIAAWKQAYVGQVLQAYLDRMDVVQRPQRWQEQSPHRVVSGLFVANVKKNAAGFVCFGNARDQDRRDWGEIYAIYVLESYWGEQTGLSAIQACVR